MPIDHRPQDSLKPAVVYLREVYSYHFPAHGPSFLSCQTSAIALRSINSSFDPLLILSSLDLAHVKHEYLNG